MQTTCYRRGQIEIGVIDHKGRIFAAFGACVSGHNITAYTAIRDGRIVLTRWDGGTMLASRSEVVREYADGSLALLFRLPNGRFIVGNALGDGMLFRGELLTQCDEERARHESLALASYWSEIDAEDSEDPWHGEPEDLAEAC